MTWIKAYGMSYNWEVWAKPNRAAFNMEWRLMGSIVLVM